ncbi:MAG: hypothetical protein KGZ58_07290 [Ignavibacteriales bacterium]|nr:hypothetical protein [Ignavibacteriales bacterium]
MKESIGIYSGVETIDRITNGFQPQQLISVSGPISNVNEAFLDNIALHAALKQQMKVDLLQRYPFGNSPLIRFLDLDIGDPSNTGWTNYKISLNKNTPDIILLNDVFQVEYLLQEKLMAKQLKEIAIEFSIPVVINAPLKKKPKRFEQESLFLRNDFDNVSDVAIIFNLKYVCNHYDKEKPIGEYYFLKTNIWWKVKSNGKINPFSSEFEMRFSDFGKKFV